MFVFHATKSLPTIVLVHAKALNAAHACGPGPLPMLSFLPSSGALDAAQVFVMVLPGPNVFNPSPNHLLASGHRHPHALGP